MVDEVVASGDQVAIAKAKAIGESNGLHLEIDKTGKAVVKTTQEIVDLYIRLVLPLKVLLDEQRKVSVNLVVLPVKKLNLLLMSGLMLWLKSMLNAKLKQLKRLKV
jgi:hypothetical protein